MIVFDLVCGHGHVFEAWFGSSADFTSQQQRRLIECPLCSNADVVKAAMAPAVPAKSNQRAASPSSGHGPNRSANTATMASAPAESEALGKLLALQRELEAKSEYVGDRFAAEARALHAAGDDRSIHGETTLAEARALAEDGVPLLPLPFRPRARLDG